MDKSTTTVELDREVVKAAKVVAAQEGITLKAYVERAMLAWVIRWPKGVQPTKDGARTLPGHSTRAGTSSVSRS
jgi:hypothetical protein